MYFSISLRLLKVPGQFYLNIPGRYLHFPVLANRIFSDPRLVLETLKRKKLPVPKTSHTRHKTALTTI